MHLYYGELILKWGGGQPGRAPGTGRGSNLQVKNVFDEESKGKGNEQEWLMLVDQLVNAFLLTFVVSGKPLKPHTQISLGGLRASGIWEEKIFTLC